MESVPIFCLQADHSTSQPNTIFDSEINRQICNIINENHFNNLLIVDDVSRNGETIKVATETVKNYLGKMIKIKNAVLYVSEKSKSSVDYYVDILETIDTLMPYGILD